MKKYTQFAIFALILGSGAFLTSSCNKDDDPVYYPTPTPTLYTKLGGTTMVSDPANPGVMIEKGRLGLRSVVDSTIYVIAGDPQLNGFFTPLLVEVGAGNTTGFAALSKNLTDFFCVGTGATHFTYSGKNMVAAHDPATNARMTAKANNANFDRFIADVVTGAQQNSVPNNLIGEVGAVIETLRADVVQAP
ncbi:MAG TPA: hypothetical protein VK476_03670 [Flavobacterium sp.]|nr:hypothetical protein [Flavobacterium sp.]